MEIYLNYFSQYFLLFLMFSFCGWTIETVGELIKSKKFVNRGFLLGPICPIYGIGSVLITIFLSKYHDDIFAVFGLSAILCGTLEYFTSFIMEKLFKARWWDYSNQKYNINGRICLETIFLFAIAGVLIIKLLSPTALGLIKLINQNALVYICSLLFFIFLIDIIISLNVMNKIKGIKVSISNNLKDNTEEISVKVREMLLEKSLPYRRILEAFPQAFADKVKEGKFIVEQTADMIKNNVNDVKDRAIDTANDVKKRTIIQIRMMRIKTIRIMRTKRYTNPRINFKNLILRKSDKEKW